jgi:hypothetical protein
MNESVGDANAQSPGTAQGQSAAADTDKSPAPVQSLLGMPETNNQPNNQPVRSEGPVADAAGPDGGGAANVNVDPDSDDAGRSEGSEDAGGDDKPVTPEDLKLPEGKQWDEALGKSFLDIVNDPKIPRAELTQKLVELYSSQQDLLVQSQAAADAALQAKLHDQQTQWLEGCKKDQEYGGHKFDESQPIIKRGCAQLATQGALDILNDYGLGMHPEIVRMFYRAGKLLGEDPGSRVPAATAPMEDPLITMYRKSLEGVK